MYLYKITNRLTGEFYIGQTIKSPDYRFRKHRELAVRGGGYFLHNALRRYGVDSFDLEVIKECQTQDELNEQEIKFIEELKPDYNICPGGTIRLSDASIEKMRQKMIGKKQSEDTIQRRFATLRQKENDPDWLAKRGKLISQGKKQTYTIEGVEYVGLDQVAQHYGISYAAARARILRGYDHWKLPNLQTSKQSY